MNAAPSLAPEAARVACDERLGRILACARLEQPDRMPVAMQSFFWPAIVAISGGVLCLVVTLTPLPRVRARMSQRGLLRWSLNRDTADDERIAT